MSCFVLIALLIKHLATRPTTSMIIQVPNLDRASWGKSSSNGLTKQSITDGRIRLQRRICMTLILMMRVESSCRRLINISMRVWRGIKGTCWLPHNFINPRIILYINFSLVYVHVCIESYKNNKKRRRRKATNPWWLNPKLLQKLQMARACLLWFIHMEVLFGSRASFKCSLLYLHSCHPSFLINSFHS